MILAPYRPMWRRIPGNILLIIFVSGAAFAGFEEADKLAGPTCSTMLRGLLPGISPREKTPLLLPERSGSGTSIISTGPYQVYSTSASVQDFFPAPHRDADGFNIGGLNTNEEISQMVGITGASFEVLDRRARPSCWAAEEMAFLDRKATPPQSELALWEGLPNRIPRRSDVGWIKSEQSVKQILLDDNATVLGLGLTHQTIASPMLVGMKAFQEEFAKRENEPSFRKALNSFFAVPFPYRGETYEISGESMASLMALVGLPPRSGWGVKVSADGKGSIFNDQIYANWHFKIRRMRDEKELQGDALTPHLIYRYGFYQGGRYRLEPRTIAQFFGLLPAKSVRKTK